MRRYTEPVLVPEISINKSLFLTQYFLNRQEMAPFNGQDFCGEVFPINDTNEMHVCLNGTEDVSSKLEGLTVILDLGSNHAERTIVSCDVENSLNCSGIAYVCTLSSPLLEHVICVTSLSDGQGNIIFCGSGTCTPGPL